jgi:hypothetical protein
MTFCLTLLASIECCKEMYSSNFQIKFYYFYWTFAIVPCRCSHNWQMPRTNLFRSYHWITFISISTKPKEKQHIVYSSIVSEMFGKLVSSWTPFPYYFKIFPTRNLCSPHKRFMFTSFRLYYLMHMFATCIMGK